MCEDGGVKCINDGIFSVAVFLWGGWGYGRKSVVKVRAIGKLLLFPFCVLCLVTQLCPTLCNPMGYVACRAPLSMGMLQARVLEWVATPVLFCLLFNNSDLIKDLICFSLKLNIANFA